MSSIVLAPPDRTELRPAFCLLVAPAAIVLAALGLVRLAANGPGVTASDVARGALVGVWPSPA